MKKTLFYVIIGLLLSMALCVGYRTEIDLGRCINAEEDGKLYNGEPFYNYISYNGLNVAENDIIMTVCLLNPFNNEYDDIIYRTDFVLLRDAK